MQNTIECFYVPPLYTFFKAKICWIRKKNVENKRRWIESDLNYCIDKCTVYKGKGFRQKLNTQFLGWAGVF